MDFYWDYHIKPCKVYGFDRFLCCQILFIYLPSGFRYFYLAVSHVMKWPVFNATH